MQAGGHLAVLEGEDSLHQTCDACGCIEMAYVGFERPDSAVAAAGCELTKRLRKGPDFDGIADDRPGSVGLDVGDVRGVDAGEIQSFGNDLGLAFNARGQITDLARAIIVNCRSENDGTDMVAIFECVFKASQYDNPQATSKDSSARSLHRRNGSDHREKESLLRGRYSPDHAGFRW